MGNREREPAIPEEGEIPLGTRIRARRWYQGIFLEDFAKQLGDYSLSYISGIENNKVEFTEDFFDKVTEVLQISDEDLAFSPREQIMEWLEIGRKKARRGRHKKSSQTF